MVTDLVRFFLLIAGAAVVTHFSSGIVATLFFIVVLLAYYRSRDEAFWLVFFLAISDGVLGFFGNYTAVLSAIPGLPAVEVGQFYILLTVVKAMRCRTEGRTFYDFFLEILLVYLVFLILQGYAIGLTMQLNIQMRVIKLLFPLLLLYSLPRLFAGEDQYARFFYYLFPLAFLALFAQLFTIATGQAPSQFLGVHQELWFAVDISEGRTYRGFYSTNTILISFFGALYHIAHRTGRFPAPCLFAVLTADCLSVYLSATRGWVISFSFVLMLFAVFILKLRVRQLALIAATGAVILLGVLSVPLVKEQITNAYRRMLTLEALAEGDLTAGGTLQRLDERSPRVMKKYWESPLTGWGFSDEFFEYGDGHVGNQNILLHSGILGALLLFLFFAYFHGKLLWRSSRLPDGHPRKPGLIVFVIFFAGWFLIHSSSGQHFGYHQEPAGAMILALFLSFGALVYRRTFESTEALTADPDL